MGINVVFYYGAALWEAVGFTEDRALKTIAAFPRADSAQIFGLGLFALLLGGRITSLVTATSIAVLLPNEQRGLCIGSFIAFAGLIGFGLGPVLVAMTSTALGGEANLPEALALVGLIISAIQTRKHHAMAQMIKSSLQPRTMWRPPDVIA